MSAIVISSNIESIAKKGISLKSGVYAVIIIVVVVAAGIATWGYGETMYRSGYSAAVNLGTGQVKFNSTELQNFRSIESQLRVINTDPNFTGDRTLQWISMRNSTNTPWDPYQKSMEFLCFWSGQGAKGEWEAVTSIDNSPGNMSDYVVEVSRFTWHSLEVTLDGNVKASFPEVTSDTTSLGYATFHVQL